MTVKPACRPFTNRRALAAALLLALAGTAAADSVGGTCTSRGKDVAFSDGVVYREPNTFDESQQDVVVVLANIALDKAAIAAADEKDDAVRDQVWEADDGAKIELHIDAEGKVWAMHYNAGGTSFSQSGTGVGELTLQTNDDKRVAAQFALDGNGQDEMRCALSFDLTYGNVAAAGKAAVTTAPAAPTGKPLPAGGGEPGEAFLANLEAMKKGDVDAMLATASKQQADEIRAERNNPEFGAMLEMMKAFAPKTVTVTGGQDFGDRAELTLVGTDESGDPMTGTVKLVKEDGAWKVEKTSMKSRSGG